jgi:hypothetical protein
VLSAPLTKYSSSPLNFRPVETCTTNSAIVDRWSCALTEISPATGLLPAAGRAPPGPSPRPTRQPPPAAHGSGGLTSAMHALARAPHLSRLVTRAISSILQSRHSPRIARHLSLGKLRVHRRGLPRCGARLRGVQQAVAAWRGRSIHGRVERLVSACKHSSRPRPDRYKSMSAFTAILAFTSGQWRRVLPILIGSAFRSGRIWNKTAPPRVYKSGAIIPVRSGGSA